VELPASSASRHISDNGNGRDDQNVDPQYKCPGKLHILGVKFHRLSDE
jgi:hypothetical protein